MFDWAQATGCNSAANGAERSSRRTREYKTIVVMLHLYCRAHHHPARGELCDDCSALQAYARRRIERCVFGEDKPTCANCTVHCYKPAMRERVRQVMRWSGPRMLWHRPVLSIRHMLDGRRPAPVIRKRDSVPAGSCYSEEGRSAP